MYIYIHIHIYIYIRYKIYIYIYKVIQPLEVDIIWDFIFCKWLCFEVHFQFYRASIPTYGIKHSHLFVLIKVTSTAPQSRLYK